MHTLLESTTVWQRILLVVGLLFMVGLGALLVMLNTDDAATKTAKEYAKEVIATCADVRYAPTCYEEEVPKLLAEIPIEETFAVIREIQVADESYRFCHVLAHKLGEREVAKDPQHWFDVIPRCPTDGLCSNGCVHGAAVERFNDVVFTEENLKQIVPDLAIACEMRDGYNPTPLDQAMCYHGIGHLTIHITEARIDAALEICDRIAVKDDGRNFERMCDEGIFMQLFQPLEPEDFALVDQLPMELSKNTVAVFCGTYSNTVAEEGACLRESWPLFAEETRTADGIVAFCAMSPSSEEDECYQSLLAIMGRSTLGDPAASHRICSGLPETRQAECFATAGMTILEEDRVRSGEAVAYCSSIATEVNRQACYDRLLQVATFVFHPADPNLRTMCSALPEPWQQQCMAKRAS